MDAKTRAYLLGVITTLVGLVGGYELRPILDTPIPPIVVDSAPTTPSPATKVPWVVGDSFTYTNTAALQKNIGPGLGGSGTSSSLYNDGNNARLVSLDTAVRYRGHATMKYTQPGGVMDTPQLWVNFPSTYSHIWYKAVVRFSPGFTTTGTLTTSSNAYKLLGWGWVGPDGSGRLEITNTTQYDFYFDVLKNGSLIGGGNHVVAGNISTEWNDGGWYVYVIEIDHSVKPAVARVWSGKDGTALTLRGTVTGTMKDGTSMPLLNRVGVGMNFNQVRAKTQAQALWIGEWSVVDAVKYASPYQLK